ncbi:hypothetical protein NHQ30_005629 [Ciborinia camelliae]|nr:hypothetical protein NHQ30_005629 [Ciborinia camelliae]
MSKALPSLPARASSLPERKPSKPMTIPRRAVGSTSSVSKKNSIASVSSSGYTDYVLSRNSSRVSNFTNDSFSYAGSEVCEAPPIPEKNEQRRSSPKTATKNSESPRSISSLEIWRRRSLVIRKGIEFPNLKLQKSNGSTASPPSKNVNSVPDRSLPGGPSEPPRSIGLSDRERDPIPTREAPQAPAVPPMGTKLSKLKDISKRKAIDQTDESSRQSDHSDDQSRHLREGNTSSSATSPYSPHGLLPTPEHLRSNKSQIESSTPQLSLPTTLPRGLSPALQVPTKSDESHSHGISISIAGGPSNTQESALVPNLLNCNHSRDLSETLTITSLPGVVRSPQPQKPHATKTILTPQPSPPIESASLSPSIASTTPTITTNPHSRQTSRTTTSRATSLSYSYFPLSPSSLPSPGTVLASPSITSQHLDCFQTHRFMRRSRNNICPLQCQTCSKADFEQQWKCTWCCLRICGDCMAVLATVRKDLRTFLGLIGRDVPNESNGMTMGIGGDIGERGGNMNQENETRRLGAKA